MDYNKIPCRESECAVSAQAREETLTAMQQRSTEMSDEILSMVRRLSVYFFGPENMKPEEKQPMPVPDCFLNDLSFHIQMQASTLDMLHKMIDKLGA